MTPLDQAHKKPVKIEKVQNIGDFQYINKFKSAFYVFILFIILSHKVAYKVLDLILKVFTNSIEVIDEQENPLILGTIIMAFIISIIIFIF